MKPMRLEPGDTLGGRYRIDSLLGQGGMASVYLAEDLKLKGKKWAVKECLPLEAHMQEFLDEAEMLAQLQHPQLPQLVDYFTSDMDDKVYLVMDYIQGPTLQDVFEQQGRELSVDAVVRYALQLCDVLHYLHTFRPRPIIYRDLKPANVMINENDQVRLIDFGVARHFTLGKQADTLQIGTIGFAAPEQFVSAQTDPRSDLYSLGAMMYYLLSGGNYVYTSQAQLAHLRPELPRKLTDTIEMLLREQPQDRCQSATEVKHRLKALLPAEHPSHSQAHSKRLPDSQVSAANKLIVVGGLYPGVGATFAAISLARVLNAYKIPHVYIEQPTGEPELYMLLYGDAKAPPSYKFAADSFSEKGQSLDGEPWVNGYTTWVPLNPEGLSGDWTAADSFKLLYSAKKPIAIWDISSNWLEPSVQELCHSADELVVVLDASPAKINRPSTRAYLDLLMAYRTRGKTVRFIANRELPAGIRQEWIAALPGELLCTLADLPYANVMRAIWKGECIQDQPAILDKMRAAFYPLLRGIIQDGDLHRAIGKPKAFFSKFKKNG
jgi:serine/threonine protein kinase